MERTHEVPDGTGGNDFNTTLRGRQDRYAERAKPLWESMLLQGDSVDLGSGPSFHML